MSERPAPPADGETLPVRSLHVGGDVVVQVFERSADDPGRPTFHVVLGVPGRVGRSSLLAHNRSRHKLDRRDRLAARRALRHRVAVAQAIMGADWAAAAATSRGAFRKPTTLGAALQDLYRGILGRDASSRSFADDLVLGFARGDVGAVARMRALLRAVRSRVRPVHGAGSLEEGPCKAVRAGIGAAKVSASAAAV